MMVMIVQFVMVNIIGMIMAMMIIDPVFKSNLNLKSLQIRLDQMDDHDDDGDDAF